MPVVRSVSVDLGETPSYKMSFAPTASAIMHVHQVTDMTKDDRQTMDDYGITCESEDVYYYKDFRYQRLADAVRYAETDSARQVNSEQGQ